MHCRTVVTVSAVELVAMPTVSVGAGAAGGRLSCELVAGHQGSHVAFAATARDGDQWWWLRWDGRSDEATELVQIDPCPAQLPQGRYADDCLLPAGHPGSHSFDVPARPPRSGERHRVGARFRPIGGRDSRRDVG